jgi:hypothetical protein
MEAPAATPGVSTVISMGDGSVNELSSQFWFDRGKQVKRARRSPDVHDRERCRVDNPLGYRFRHDRE